MLRRLVGCYCNCPAAQLLGGTSQFCVNRSFSTTVRRAAPCTALQGLPQSSVYWDTECPGKCPYLHPNHGPRYIPSPLIGKETAEICTTLTSSRGARRRRLLYEKYFRSVHSPQSQSNHYQKGCSLNMTPPKMKILIN